MNWIDEEMCTGCGACESICPNSAITLEFDEQGYRRAQINKQKCLNCGACVNVCHMKKKLPDRKVETKYYAAVSKDINNVIESSSGGIFFELAKKVIDNNGVVYGASLNKELTVCHQRVSTIEELYCLRKSKYIESNMKGVYTQVSNDLQMGKQVLFSGTGCQVAGLYAYARKTSNLVTCEVVCHGIPSEKVFELYCKEQATGIRNINFRDKRNGWLSNSVCELYMDGNEKIIPSDEHPFHKIYLKGINMRGECGECRYAKVPRIADVTLADFWKYRGKLYERYSKYGISLVVVNTNAGKKLFDKISEKIDYEEVSSELAKESCRHLFNSPKKGNNQRAFYKLIPLIGYNLSGILCETFEYVEVSDNLCLKEKIMESDIIDIFKDNDVEIIYIHDENKVVRGIITFESYINSLISDVEYVQNDFQAVNICEDVADKIIDVFRKNPQIQRVPVLDENNRILCEVRRRNSPQISNEKIKQISSLEALVRNADRNNRVLFVRRPNLLEITKYTELQKYRIENKLSFPVMSAEYNLYKNFLETILGKKCNEEYIEDLRRIPPIVEIGGLYRHKDQVGQLVNVCGGERMTSGQPRVWDYSIHIYGRCGVFGYAVEDRETLPSHLQKIINKNNQKIRVTNRGLWGADNKKILDNLKYDMENGKIEKDDWIILYMDDIPYMELLKKTGCLYYDTSNVFYDTFKDKEIFFDKPGHMNSEGYKYIATKIYELLIKYSDRECAAGKISLRLNDVFLKWRSNNELSEGYLESYIKKIEQMTCFPYAEGSSVGAIVMNCNPFTLGHRYLIEKAASEKDILIIFVLEEDKSFFKFTDRYEMVRRGCEDLSNVFVVPSGQFVLSAITFPEYFIKEQEKEVCVDASRDIEIFAEYIAPRLGIKTRYVGTEPIDGITAQYNEQLKKILPKYNLELKEIERVKCKEVIVSATKVRKAIKGNDLQVLKSMLPDTTLFYLKEKGMI